MGVAITRSSPSWFHDGAVGRTTIAGAGGSIRGDPFLNRSRGLELDIPFHVIARLDAVLAFNSHGEVFVRGRAFTTTDAVFSEDDVVGLTAAAGLSGIGQVRTFVTSVAFVTGDLSLVVIISIILVIPVFQGKLVTTARKGACHTGIMNVGGALEIMDSARIAGSISLLGSDEGRAGTHTFGPLGDVTEVHIHGEPIVEGVIIGTSTLGGVVTIKPLTLDVVGTLRTKVDKHVALLELVVVTARNRPCCTGIASTSAALEGRVHLQVGTVGPLVVVEVHCGNAVNNLGPCK
jgi:hypothetical protein